MDLASSKINLLKIQQTLNSHLRTKALSYEGQGSQELRAYQKYFKSYAKRPIKKSSFEEFARRVLNSSVLFVGDFHTFDQNSKNFIRLIRWLKKEKQKFSIAIEFIDAVNQSSIDAFLNSYISEMEFLEQIDYKESWKFPWIHYRPIFDFCKQNKIKIIALNSVGSLKKRDCFAAKLLSQNLEKFPNEKLLVLFGELHLAEDKLPAQLRKAYRKSSLKMVSLHQNLEEIYWRLPQDKVQNASTFWKIGKNEFVLQNSPPWIKYESMIYWYENLVDDPDFDVHEYLLETGSKLFSSSAPDNFLYLSKLLNETLQLNIASLELEDFNLYDHQSLELIIQKIKKIKPIDLQKFYVDIINNGRVFRIANTRDYYCSNYTINRLTFLVGQHLFASYLYSKKQFFDEQIFSDIKKSHFFNYFLLQSVFSYYCSKLINPYRKCNHYVDFKERLKTLKKNGYEFRITNLTIKYLKHPESLYKEISGLKLIDLFLIARNIGYSITDLAHAEDLKNREFASTIKTVLSQNIEDEFLASFIKKLLGEQKRTMTKRQKIKI
ncbi:MAG: hypothetical protein Fur0010_04860 [Bdellovibrio sp.]